MKFHSSVIVAVLLCSLTLSASARTNPPPPSHPPVSPPKAASALAKPADRTFKTRGEHVDTLILHPDGTYWKTFVMSTGGNGVDHMDVEDGKYVISGRRIVFTTQTGVVSRARYSATRIDPTTANGRITHDKAYFREK